MVEPRYTFQITTTNEHMKELIESTIMVDAINDEQTTVSIGYEY